MLGVAGARCALRRRGRRDAGVTPADSCLRRDRPSAAFSRAAGRATRTDPAPPAPGGGLVRISHPEHNLQWQNKSGQSASCQVLWAPCQGEQLDPFLINVQHNAFGLLKTRPDFATFQRLPIATECKRQRVSHSPKKSTFKRLYLAWMMVIETAQTSIIVKGI